MAGMLRDTIQREGLAGCVTMLGAVPTHAVRDVLVRARKEALCICCREVVCPVDTFTVLSMVASRSLVSGADSHRMFSLRTCNTADVVTMPARVAGAGTDLPECQPDRGVLHGDRGGGSCRPAGRLHCCWRGARGAKLSFSPCLRPSRSRQGCAPP